ncbi:MAG: hypothetical protein NMNS02_20600 [Nitrosomonas sp.]|nr:MAG: hypothetical protein NMNS02_20600 [Nitrosomonas sp.]
MHQIVNECEKIVDEITHATNHDEIEASKSKMNAFNIELAKKINKASRQTANTVQQCVQKNFKNRKIVENCSAGILITNLQNHYDKFASNYKDTKYQWNDMDVCPIALDKKTYDDVIYEWKKIHSKDLKSFKIADSTPIQEVMGKRARFVKNDLVNYLNPSSPSTNTIPLESIECICKANAVLIIPIHSVDVKNHSYFPFGFISVFSENKSKKSLFNNNRDTEIYNQLSLCSDSLSSLFMLSLIVTKKVNLAYRLKKDLINSHDQINNQET